MAPARLPPPRAWLTGKRGHCGRDQDIASRRSVPFGRSTPRPLRRYRQPLREPRTSHYASLERLDAPHGCYAGVVYVGHMVVGDDGEEVEVFEAVLCKSCPQEGR